MKQEALSMKYPDVFSRLVNASVYSLQGLWYALRHEQAFQYEAAVLVVLVCVSRNIYLAGSWLIVMCLELVNSAVEKAFDLIDEDFRPQIKAGKDMLSASVFLSVVFNVILWCIFFSQDRISHSGF